MTAPAESRFDRFAGGVSSASLGCVFLLFIAGVGMRYVFNRPISWIDEAVTVLTVWSVLWTAAFRLRWPDHIAFDVIFIHVSACTQRLMLLLACSLFVLLMLAALPGMVDYTLFLSRERTDMLELRLDWVYAAFPVFFMVVVARLLLSIRRLAGANWQRELQSWGAPAAEDTP